MKKMKQIERMLEEKGLLERSSNYGEIFDVDGIISSGFESEPYHKLLILRSTMQVSNFGYTSCVNFMVQKNSLAPEVAKKIVEKEAFSQPYYILIVNDIDAAEAAVKEFLNGELTKPTQVSRITVADIEATPENKWVDTHNSDGTCPYCGREIPYHYVLCGREFEACTCEVGKAAYAHNQRARQLQAQ